MTPSDELGLADVHVAHVPVAAHAPAAAYDPSGGVAESVAMPELPADASATPALVGVRRLLAAAGLDSDHLGTPSWNPLGQWIRPGAKVLVKPNWVFHRNSSGGGLDCLLTHTSLIEALLYYVMKAQPGRVVLGDAPIQGCDFPALLAAQGVDDMCQRFQRRGMAPTVADFRCTVLPGGQLWSRRETSSQVEEAHVLFDLGDQSALEPITAPDTPFRVAMYDPRGLRETHAPGRHQYLIAREALEADVVFNVPKLKTHRMAGLTAAMKNLVGTNGHKEYLPHHRKGGSERQGDCYPGDSWLKRCAEDFLDCANSSGRGAARFFHGQAATTAIRLSRWLGYGGDVEGSWHGNDTIWRTCLDLQRILRYGRTDGTLAQRQQREILHLTDAVIAGEGEGPLAPQPVPLGLLTLGRSAAAVDFVHALLMGVEPTAIPMIRHAFPPHAHRLVDFSPDQIRVSLDGEPLMLADVFAVCGRPFRLSQGWRGHCELPRSKSGGPVRC